MDRSRLDGFVPSSRGRKRLPTHSYLQAWHAVRQTGTPISPILRVFIYCALVCTQKAFDLRKLPAIGLLGSPQRWPPGKM